MDWIMIRTTLYEHPKMLKMSRLLRVKQAEALGLCVLLWSKAYGITRNGDLGYAPEDLDQLIGKRGLTDALVAVEWASISDDGCVVLNDWHKYCGQQQDRQEAARKKQQRYRDRMRGVTSIESNELRNVTVTNSNTLQVSTELGSKEGSKEGNKKDTTSVVSKKARQRPLPSSFNECLDLLPEKLLAMDRDVTLKWFLERQASGWVNGSGRKIVDWLADLELWHVRERSVEPSFLNVNDAQNKNNAPGGFVPDTSVSVY